jgi:hypothetical protein
MFAIGVVPSRRISSEGRFRGGPHVPVRGGADRIHLKCGG